jgi:hypothetical protein
MEAAPRTALTVANVTPLPYIGPATTAEFPGYAAPLCPVGGEAMIWILAIDPDRAGPLSTVGAVQTGITQPHTSSARVVGVSAILVCGTDPTHTMAANVRARCLFSARLEPWVPGGPPPWAPVLAKST